VIDVLLGTITVVFPATTRTLFLVIYRLPAATVGVQVNIEEFASINFGYCPALQTIAKNLQWIKNSQFN
jgi:hypothetical protein